MNIYKGDFCLSFMSKTENFDAELAALWNLASERLRNKLAYVNSLEELLRANGITEKSMIIDVAGGFGFPSIDLAKRGWQINYMDGSPGMLERAMRNADIAGAPAYIFSFQAVGYTSVTWQNLKDGVQSRSFDALLCTGNSLPYAVSWGRENANLSTVRKQIISALNQFRRILKKGGVAFIDKQPEAQEFASEEIGEIELEGRKYSLTSVFRNDKERRIRNWTLRLKDLESGDTKEYPSTGYLLLEDELIPILREVGFKGIEKHVLRGDIYEGFIVRK